MALCCPHLGQSRVSGTGLLCATENPFSRPPAVLPKVHISSQPFSSFQCSSSTLWSRLDGTVASLQSDFHGSRFRWSQVLLKGPQPRLAACRALASREEVSVTIFSFADEKEDEKDAPVTSSNGVSIVRVPLFTEEERDTSAEPLEASGTLGGSNGAGMSVTAPATSPQEATGSKLAEADGTTVSRAPRGLSPKPLPAPGLLRGPPRPSPPVTLVPPSRSLSPTARSPSPPSTSASRGANSTPESGQSSGMGVWRPGSKSVRNPASGSFRPAFGPKQREGHHSRVGADSQDAVVLRQILEKVEAGTLSEQTAPAVPSSAPAETSVEVSVDVAASVAPEDVAASVAPETVPVLVPSSDEISPGDSSPEELGEKIVNTESTVVDSTQSANAEAVLQPTVVDSTEPATAAEVVVAVEEGVPTESVEPESVGSEVLGAAAAVAPRLQRPSLRLPSSLKPPPAMGGVQLEGGEATAGSSAPPQGAPPKLGVWRPGQASASAGGSGGKPRPKIELRLRGQAPPPRSTEDVKPVLRREVASTSAAQDLVQDWSLDTDSTSSESVLDDSTPAQDQVETEEDRVDPETSSDVTSAGEAPSEVVETPAPFRPSLSVSRPGAVRPARPSLVLSRAPPPAPDRPGLWRPGMASTKEVSDKPDVRLRLRGEIEKEEAERVAKRVAREATEGADARRGRRPRTDEPAVAKPAGTDGKPADDRRKKVDAGKGRRPDARGSGKDLDTDTGPVAKLARGRKARKLQRQEQAQRDAPVRVELLEVGKAGMTVEDLAKQLAVNQAEVIKTLFMKGIVSTVNQTLNDEAVKLVCAEFGVEVLEAGSVRVEDLAKKTDEMLDDADLEMLVARPPVVTIMGHVDHGKTSLLDHIRKSKVAAGEAGGITQGIGAYRVKVNVSGVEQTCVFLDTPGHEAFSAMRARGARVTDIAIIVVAADDGVRPQTLEAIAHARAAKVPIIIAINKIDKAGANPDRVMQELVTQGLMPEEWGGDVPMVPVSALTGENVSTLLETATLVAEFQDLRANPDRAARGTVIEAMLEKARGPVATLLVQNGTLRRGDIILSGETYGKVRALLDDTGVRDNDAGPSAAVQVLGLSTVPVAGDTFEVVATLDEARDKAAKFASTMRDARLTALAGESKTSLSSLAASIAQNVGVEQHQMNLILKVDVQGTLEALREVLSQLPQDSVSLKVLLQAAGDVSLSDVDLASASDAVILGFNIAVPTSVQAAADVAGVEVRQYRVIYDLVDDVRKAMEGKLEPVEDRLPLGMAEVRAVFGSGSSKVAGCMVTEGKLTKGCSVSVKRKGEVVYTGELSSLRRVKELAKEVVAGLECGVGVVDWNDWSDGDKIEAFTTSKKQLSLEEASKSVTEAIERTMVQSKPVNA